MINLILPSPLSGRKEVKKEGRKKGMGPCPVSVCERIVMERKQSFITSIHTLTELPRDLALLPTSSPVCWSQLPSLTSRNPHPSPWYSDSLPVCTWGENAGYFPRQSSCTTGILEGLTHAWAHRPKHGPRTSTASPGSLCGASLGSLGTR